MSLKATRCSNGKNYEKKWKEMLASRWLTSVSQKSDLHQERLRSSVTHLSSTDTHLRRKNGACFSSLPAFSAALASVKTLQNRKKGLRFCKHIFRLVSGSLTRSHFLSFLLLHSNSQLANLSSPAKNASWISTSKWLTAFGRVNPGFCDTWSDSVKASTLHACLSRRTRQGHVTSCTHEHYPNATFPDWNTTLVS